MASTIQQIASQNTWYQVVRYVALSLHLSSRIQLFSSHPQVGSPELCGCLHLLQSLCAASCTSSQFLAKFHPRPLLGHRPPNITRDPQILCRIDMLGSDLDQLWQFCLAPWCAQLHTSMTLISTRPKHKVSHRPIRLNKTRPTLLSQTP